VSCRPSYKVRREAYATKYLEVMAQFQNAVDRHTPERDRWAAFVVVSWEAGLLQAIHTVTNCLKNLSPLSATIDRARRIESAIPGHVTISAMFCSTRLPSFAPPALLQQL